MHTFRAKNGTTFMYNGDFSGDIEIIEKHGAKIEYIIDGEDLLEFARKVVAQDMIRFLEEEY